MNKKEYVDNVLSSINHQILHERLRMAAQAALAVVSARKRMRDLNDCIPVENDKTQYAMSELETAIGEIEEALADERLSFEMGFNFAKHAVSNGLDGMIAEQIAAAMAQKEEHSLSDPEVRKQVLAMTNGVCAYCDAALSDVPVVGQSTKLCIEHVVPASKGGPNHLVNYVPSCGSCNSAKGDRHVLHFVRNVQPRRQEQSTVVSIVRAAE